MNVTTSVSSSAFSPALSDRPLPFEQLKGAILDGNIEALKNFLLTQEEKDALLHFVHDERTFCFLFDMGTNLNARDERGNTPLHSIVQAGYPELIPLFAKNGASELVQEVVKRGSALINAQNQEGETPLMLALRYKQGAAVSVLLNNGADLEVSTKQRGVLLMLHFAAYHGVVKAIRPLLLARADPNKSDHAGQTPLHIAAARGNTEFLQELLSMRGVSKEKLQS